VSESGGPSNDVTKEMTPSGSTPKRALPRPLLRRINSSPSTTVVVVVEVVVVVVDVGAGASELDETTGATVVEVVTSGANVSDEPLPPPHAANHMNTDEATIATIEPRLRILHSLPVQRMRVSASRPRSTSFTPPCSSTSTTVTEALSRLSITSRSSPVQAPMTALMAMK